MAENSKMKPVKGYGIVNKSDGDLWFEHVFATKSEAVAVLGSAEKDYRIAPVRITEVKP